MGNNAAEMRRMGIVGLKIEFHVDAFIEGARNKVREEAEKNFGKDVADEMDFVVERSGEIVTVTVKPKAE